MKGKAFIKFLIPVLYFLFQVSSAYAVSPPETWNYTTHGGYDAAVEAWKRVSLLFSHSGFLSLFATTFIAGILGFVISLLLKAAVGARISFQMWFTYLLAGALIYLAFIVPKDNIIIYDETLNRGPYQVDGVPKILATTAGILNKIEKGIVELIAQSSDPVQDYRYNPAGIAFNSLGSVEIKQIPSYKFQTLYNYFKDCIVVGAEMGTYLNWDDLTSGRKTLIDAVNAAANPALYTVVYNQDGSDSTLDCRSASSTVINYINSIDNFDKALRAGCARAGYDPDSVASYQMCKNMMGSAASFLLYKAGLSLSSPNLLATVLQQMLFSHISQTYVLNNGPAAVGAYLATQKTTGSFIGLGIHANSWIPELKESLSAIVIALSPFILIFLVSPLAGRAFSVLVGMLLWITIWGVVDALIFSFGLSMAGSTAKYLATGGNSEGFGLFAASILPNTTAKIYAIFGALRWSGLVLASVLTTILVRFGGAALTMLAGQIASAPMASGSAVGEAMAVNPVQTVTSSIEPAQTWANTAFAMGGMKNLIEQMVRKNSMQMAGELSAVSSMSSEQLLKGAFGNFYSHAIKGGAETGIITTVGGERYRKVHQGAAAYNFAGLAAQAQQIEKRGMEKITNAFYGNQTAQLEKGQAVKNIVDREGLENYSLSVQAQTEYDYLKGLGTAELFKILSKEDIIEGTAGREITGLITGKKDYEVGLDLLTNKVELEKLNEIGKTLSRKALIDYLQDGQISQDTALKLAAYEELGKRWTGGSPEVLLGHHQSLEYTVNTQENAKNLSTLLRTPINAGDRVSLAYSLHKTDDERYVLEIVKANAALGGERQFTYSGHSFRLQGVEMTQIGKDYREFSKGTLLIGSSSALTLDFKKGMVLNQGRLVELHGGFRGTWKDFQAFAKEHGLWDDLKTNSRALKAIKEIINRGEIVNINYNRGHLAVSAGGNILFERKGVFEDREAVDTQSTYKSGVYRQHMDFTEVKKGKHEQYINLNETITGNKIVDASEVIVKHGTDEQSWFYFVHNPESRLAKEHFHRMITDKAYRDQSLKELAKNLSNFYERKLTDQGFGRAYTQASAGLRLGGVGVGGGVEVGHYTTDVRSFNYNLQQVYSLWDKAYQNTVKQFGGKDYNVLSTAEKKTFESQLRKTFYGSISQTYKDYINQVKNQDVDDYGATAYVSRGIKKATKFGNKVKKVWNEVNQPPTEKEKTAFIAGQVKQSGIVEPPSNMANALKNLPKVKPQVVSLPSKN